MRLRGIVQTSIRLLYPPTCLTCDTMVETEGGLCGPCWRETPFIDGAVCGGCGAPLVAGPVTDDVLCDDCLRVRRPWAAGRSALVYRDNGRRLVLGLKHGDRMEVARPATRWMARAARGMVTPDMVVVPVPLHWLRRIKRRYNQSALLGRALAREIGLTFCADMLERPRATPPLDGMSPDKRHETLEQALSINTRRQDDLQGRPVLLIDDVMTSGATLSAATGVLQAAGSGPVSVLTLARAVKDA